MKSWKNLEIQVAWKSHPSCVCLKIKNEAH